MIEIQMHPTNTIYRKMAATLDLEERERLFLEELLAPFDMVALGQRFGGMEPMALARMFTFLMPEQLDSVPPALEQLETADAWTIAERALREGAARFAPYADQIPLKKTTAGIYLTDPARAMPINRGYNGSGGTPGEIFLTFDTPNDYNLPRLPGLTVHELHHNIRFAAVPWGPQTTLGDYMISEGLAESFAAALYGEEIVGYYVTDITPGDLEIARRLIRDNHTTTDFNLMRGYIFGSGVAGQMGVPDVGMPNFGGYAVGYHVVQAYLRRTGDTIEGATMRPSAELIAESGYFAD